MELDPAACYRVLLARDARYDGRFFVGVRTTSIYCRPICPAGPPRPENCVFLPSAAAAHAARFRPCLRCRPESAPQTAAWRGTAATVSRALSLIEAGALDRADVGALAARLGLGERQLRRLFGQHLGASPIAVAQTRRVLLAKQLIHGTGLSMTEVALASGFASLRRFNECFSALFGRPPTALRRPRAEPEDAGLRLLLPYRPPYDWAAMLGFLAARAIPGVETVSDGTYRRVIALDGTFGWLAVSHAQAAGALAVTVHFARLGALPAIIARLRRVFDLGADPGAIGAALGRDPALAPLLAARPGLRVPGAWDGFEVAIRAVLGQQVSVAAATRLAGKLVATIGPPCPVAPGLTHAFPEAERFDPTAVAVLAMPRARAATLVGLAQAVRADPDLFAPHRDLAAAVAHLRGLPGIGEWTAQYIAMRALRESDAFLAGDVALQRALACDGVRPNARELLERAEAWRPWRAYAVLHFWTADAAQTAAARGNSAPAVRNDLPEDSHALAA